MNYKKRLFLNFIIIFAIFTIVILVFQYHREQNYRKELLKEKLSSYTDVFHQYIENNKNHLASHSLDSIDYKEFLGLINKDLRVTVIDKKGHVFYDNVAFQNQEQIENHLERPEIISANINNSAYAIRTSSSTNQKYYYYAECFDEYYIRVAHPFNINLDILLEPDNLYIIFILSLFVVALLWIRLVSDQFGNTLARLRDFAYSPQKSIKFPSGELGEIGTKLRENYLQLQKQQELLQQERDKLILHFNHSKKGVAFFNQNYETIYTNSLFVTYLNSITDNFILSLEELFQNENFKICKEAIEEADKTSKPVSKEYKINKNNQYYSVRITIFEDKNIELSIDNITEVEKNKILKQEITSNIAHELRTPISSISAYLETIIEQDNLSEEQKKILYRKNI